MLDRIKKSYFWQCAALSLEASWNTANNLTGTVIAGVATMIHSITFLNGVSTFVKAENALITLVIYTFLSWIIIFLFRIILIAPYQLYRLTSGKTKTLENRIASKISNYISWSFLGPVSTSSSDDRFPANYVFLSRIQNNTEKTLLNCQIKLNGYILCAPFNLRPEEIKNVPIIFLAGLLRQKIYAVVYSYNEKDGLWLRNSSAAWLIQPGTYSMEFLSDDMISVRSDVVLSHNSEWELTLAA